MKFLVFTMVHNESANLDRWVNYYSQQLGRENLAVIDHGSDDGSVERLDGIAHIKMPRSTFDDYERADIVSHFQQNLQPHYQAIIYVDCDEFLVPEPRRYGSLYHYLVEFTLGQAVCVRAVGLNVVHMIDHEAPFDTTGQIFAQRKYVAFHSLYCKPAVVKEKVTWLVGCHQSTLPSLVDPELYLFHLRDIDHARALQRLAVTRAFDWSASNVEGLIGYHQRLSDDDYTEAQFLSVQRAFDEEGAQRFEFASEIERVNLEQPGDFRGRIAAVPKRFLALL